MPRLLTVVFSFYLLFAPLVALSADTDGKSSGTTTVNHQIQRENSTEDMLVSLLDLQKNLNEQIRISKKIKGEQLGS